MSTGYITLYKGYFLYIKVGEPGVKQHNFKDITLKQLEEKRKQFSNKTFYNFKGEVVNKYSAAKM